MSLITDHVNVIQSEKDGLGSLHTFCRYGVGILKTRIDHNHTDDCSQIRVGTECFCCRKRDEDL